MVKLYIFYLVYEFPCEVAPFKQVADVTLTSRKPPNTGGIAAIVCSSAARVSPVNGRLTYAQEQLSRYE